MSANVARETAVPATRQRSHSFDYVPFALSQQPATPIKLPAGAKGADYHRVVAELTSSKSRNVARSEDWTNPSMTNPSPSQPIDRLPTNNQEAGSRTGWPVLMAFVWKALVVTCWLAAAVDWTVRDRWIWAAVVFYATPPSLLGAFSLTLAGFGWKGKQKRKFVGSAVLLGVVLVGLWVLENFRPEISDGAPPNSIRVLFWNVGRGDFGSWEEISQQLSVFDADVIALAEATADEVQTADFWQSRLPEYQALPLGGGLLVLAKGQLGRRGAATLAGGGRFRRVAVKVRDVELDLILADIISSPLRSREPPLRKLAEVLAAQRDRPTLVVGDFNTPPNSVWFDDWRKEWTHAWDVSGEGYRATWPLPVPILTLDQVWGNREIEFHRCIGSWSSSSDHRAVVVDLSVEMRASSTRNTINVDTSNISR